MNYNEAKAYLAGGRDKISRPYANNTRIEERKDGAIAVKLHATDVVTLHPDGRMVLNSGGWKTLTTRERMNRFASRRIYQKNGRWYVTVEGGDVLYFDGITLFPDGTTDGAVPTDEKAHNARKRAIRRYAKAFIDAMKDGNVPAPSGGDCWFCCMFPEGKSNTEHLESHLTEKYYVPSLMVRATKDAGLSQITRDWLTAYWISKSEGHPQWNEARKILETGFYSDHASEYAAKALVKYLYRQFGLAA